jgi:flagellar hook-length control protein FliK
MLGAKPTLKEVAGGVKEGASEFGNELTITQSMNNLVGAHGAQAAPIAIGVGKATEVTAHVVQGANAESRLTSETLAGIAGGLRNLSAQSTGGEMRIRLKPENLGELHVRVVTDGRNVGLQIQASDDKARKVIEESMSHLKDSLAAQNLSLGTVDLTVAQSHGSSFGQNQGHEQAQGQWQGASSDLLGQNQSGQSHNREGGGGFDRGGFARSSRPATLGAPAAAQAFGPARAAYASSGRLDVTA